ncbi:MAG: DUF1801 domain-containing protein [Patescibacteria group bacterium]
MAELKTKQNDASVEAFITSVPDEQRRTDAKQLLTLFKKVTGLPPKMWGGSIIGFGSYHYKSERSRQEGDWPLTGFSPRKQQISIYIMNGFDDYQNELTQLGKHKHSVSCLYVKRLSDIDLSVLEEIIRRSVKAMKSLYPVNSSS